MKNAFRSDISPSEITSRTLFESRRRWMQGSLASLATMAIAPASAKSRDGKDFPVAFESEKSEFSTAEKLTTYSDVTRYNNFYEFGTGKEDPVEQIKKLSELRDSGAITEKEFTEKKSKLMRSI